MRADSVWRCPAVGLRRFLCLAPVLQKKGQPCTNVKGETRGMNTVMGQGVDAAPSDVQFQIFATLGTTFSTLCCTENGTNDHNVVLRVL